MSIEGQGHFFTIYFSGFVCFVLYYAKISGERLQDHWSSGLIKGLWVYRMHFLTMVMLSSLGMNSNPACSVKQLKVQCELSLTVETSVVGLIQKGISSH